MLPTTAFMCLALNVYWEARNQPLLGQAAVAQVVLNRVHSVRFPNDVCSVVTQGGTTRHRCQFSWYCDGKSDLPTDAAAWRVSRVVAQAMMEGARVPEVRWALWYHADYVLPPWAHDYVAVAWIGNHIFYEER